MSETVEPTAWPTGETEAVLGLHGMKQRWAELTAGQGLLRSSAAWFLIDSAATAGEISRTLAVAVHLGLGTATCDTLAALPTPGGYTQVFRGDPGLLPAVLCFADRPTGSEITHRYLWLGPPAAGRTVPYTKIERAGRNCAGSSAVSPNASTVRIGLNDVSSIEEELDRMGRPTGPGRLVTRSDQPVAHEEPVLSKLGWFCVQTAELLWARGAGSHGDRAP